MYLPNLGKIAFPSRENSGVNIGNPKILEKNSPKIGGGGQVPQLALHCPIPELSPIPLGGGDMGLNSILSGCQ